MSSPSTSSNGNKNHTDDMWLVEIEVEVEAEGIRAGGDKTDRTARVFCSAEERDRYIASAITDDTINIKGYSVRKIVVDDGRVLHSNKNTVGPGAGERQQRQEKTKSITMTAATTTTTAQHHQDKDDGNFSSNETGEIIISSSNNNKKNNNENDNDDDDDYSDNFDKKSQGFDALVKRFELFRRVIEHEDDLLNQRMSWIILAQSFLMAAFISSSNNNTNGGRPFLYITAAVGLLTVLVTMPALIAAGRNIEVQQRVYFLGLSSDELCRRLHGHDRDMKWGGDSERNLRHGRQIQNGTHLSAHVLPNTAFRSKFGVPILTTVVLLSIVQVAGWCCLLVALMMEEV